MQPRMLALAVLISSLTLPVAAFGAPAAFVLTDPKNDDYGDGTLRYPTRDDMREGDLDLIELGAEYASDGTWFTATFRNNVRPPGTQIIDSVGKPLSDLARLGFYTFNIDIYVDTDRTEGSGNTATLPGRRLTIDPRTAWEKVISLSPRPDQSSIIVRREMTQDAKAEVKQNKQRVDDEDLKLARRYVKETLESDFWFVRNVQVIGRKVKFFVPSGFLGGKARPDWAYTVVVTGAALEPRLDGTQLIGKAGLEEDFLLIPVGTGLSATHFKGRDEDQTQSPAVDIIVPAGQKQEEVLKDYDIRTDRFAVLTGVVPKDAPAPGKK